MSGRARLIAVIAAIVVVLLLFFFFVIRPARSELAETTAAADAAEEQTRILTVELQRLRALQQNEAQLLAELEELRGYVPRRNAVSSFILQVQDAAEAAGVEFVEITPGLPAPPPEAPEIAQVQLDIRAEGGYFAIQDFVRRLYSFERAFRVDVAGLTVSDEEDDEISLQATGRIFFEAPEGAAAAVAPAPADETEEEPAG